MRVSLLTCLAVTLVTVTTAQVFVIPLTGVRRTPTAELARPLGIPVRCDDKGNLYFRGYQFPNTGLAPIVRLSSKGDKNGEFSTPNIEGVTPGEVYSYDLQPDGTVFALLGDSKDDSYLLKFNTTGGLVSKVRLDVPVHGYGLFVFDNGNALVSGGVFSKDEGKPHDFTALFNASGKMIRKIGLHSPASPPSTEESIEPELPPDVRDSTRRFGDLIHGPGGMAYMVRGRIRPQVRVIDSLGRVTRSFPLKPPSGDVQLESASVAQGLLLGQFLGTDKEGNLFKALYALYDFETGEIRRIYGAPLETGFAFACGTDDNLVFLTSKDQRLYITEVPLH